jgi:hypothetical protein
MLRNFIFIRNLRLYSDEYEDCILLGYDAV